MIVFRDDDISKDTDLKQFRVIHEMFLKHNVTHVIAVIAKDIEKHVELIRYIRTTPNFEVQLHCYDHIDLTKNHDVARYHLRAGKKILERIFNGRVTIWYPAWNKVDDYLIEIANELLLIPKPEKISLSNFISLTNHSNFSNISETINFHYWADECKDLDLALQRYNKIRNNK
jgi:peptidoglycan/xylan/chitin deacetylase (PgdA/CDA1 family)